MCQRDLMDALERLPIPSFAFDLSTLRMIAANHRFEQLLGYSREELHTLTAEEIRPERELSLFRASLRVSDSTGLLRARYLRKDGRELEGRIHYHHLGCLGDNSQPIDARMVVVEFWDDNVAVVDYVGQQRG
jgi:PAS domain S-box-containing protein